MFSSSTEQGFPILYDFSTSGWMTPMCPTLLSPKKTSTCFDSKYVGFWEIQIAYPPDWTPNFFIIRSRTPCTTSKPVLWLSEKRMQACLSFFAPVSVEGSMRHTSATSNSLWGSFSALLLLTVLRTPGRRRDLTVSNSFDFELARVTALPAS